MAKKTGKTIQLGLRVDIQLLDRIKKLANVDKIDKMSWIRQSLSTFISNEEKKVIDEIIENYINLRCDENELKRVASFNKIPKDIQNARRDVVLKMKNGVNNSVKKTNGTIKIIPK